MLYLAVTSFLPTLLLGSFVSADVVAIDIRKEPPTAAHLKRRDLTKRATVTESLLNNATGGMYMANVTVGTPPQNIALIIDTGSSDVWMLSTQADICESKTAQKKGDGCIGGTFNSSSSSTATVIGRNGFTIQYEDSTGSFGDWITDDFSINGAEVKDLQMGLAYTSTSNVGVMGIGYDTNEASSAVYSNFIDEMVSQGVIPVKAYSLYLNDLQSSTGSILFGGIDTEKYTGSLTSIPIQSISDTGQIQTFSIALTGVGVSGEAGNTTTVTNSSFAEAVVLDSGTTLTYLPNSLAAEIFTYFDAIDASSTYGNVYVNCDLRDTASKMTVNYAFGTSGPEIRVPISELIFDMEGVYGSGTVNGGSAVSQLQPFARTCAFGIQTAGSGTNLLGDTFLRSAYAVYDLKNNQISLAQTDFNSTGSNVVEFSADETGVAYVDGLVSASAATVSSITATATGAQVLGKGGSTTTKAMSATGTVAGGTTTAAAATATKTSKGAAIRVMVPRVDGFAFYVLALAGLSMIGGGVGFLI